MDQQADTSQRRGTTDEIRRLVVELNSYSQAAARLGVSRQYVNACAGPGLTTRAQARRFTHCTNCGRDLATVKRKGRLCHRCYCWARTHGAPWSAEAAAAARHAPKTHCKRGHPLTPENVYVVGNTRQCRQCRLEQRAAWRKTAAGQAAVKANNARSRARRREAAEQPAN